MILTLRLGDKQVTASCPDGVLVLNEGAWLQPKVGGYATLVYAYTVDVPQRTYPVNTMPSNTFSLDTNYVCLIEQVQPGDQLPHGVQSTNKISGTSLCLVCNLGTHLQNVKVHQL